MKGIPILAHHIIHPELLSELLEFLIPFGLVGVELISSNATINDLTFLSEMER